MCEIDRGKMCLLVSRIDGRTCELVAYRGQHKLKLYSSSM